MQSPLTSFELINYFLMRMLDKDFVLRSLGDDHQRNAAAGLREIWFIGAGQNKISKKILATSLAEKRCISPGSQRFPIHISTVKR